MSLGAPLGLLTLLGLLPLIAAYFLRRKQPPRTVSALFLWRSPDQRAEAGPRFKRFSRELSLLLEMLALLAATAFLSDVRFGKQQVARQLMVVVDGGLSLRARVNGVPVYEKVKTAVAQKAESEQATALTILESGVRPTVLAGPQLETSRALASLEAWVPSQPSHDVLAALNLAREMSATVDQHIVFFTDGPPAEGVTLPANVEVISMGTALPNVAIISAQRRDENGTALLTVRIANNSQEKRTLPVRFEGETTQTHKLELAPDATGVVRLTMKTAGDITVRLPDDALPEDSVLTLTASPLAEVTVSVLDSLDAATQSALSRFLKIAPGIVQQSPSLLTFGPPDSQATVTMGAKAPLKSFVGPFFAQKNHPLLDDVQLGGAVWTAGTNPPGRSLMSAGEVVLISEDDDGRLHFNLDVSRSNVQKTVAWPVLLSNVVRQARLRREGFARRHLMLGEEVPLTVSSGATWQLKLADGTQKPILGTGQLTLPAPSRPGALVLMRDSKPIDTAMVLAIEPRESDLQTRGPFSNAAPVATQKVESLQERPRSLWPIVVMMVLLMGSLFITARRPA